jgi:UDP-N-acetyl-D-glucosamine/UDP-N-acetyl-D-galactosamine dehydrogenase
VIVLGMTFTEDVFGRECTILGLPAETEREYRVTLTPLERLQPADAAIVTVAYRDYVIEGWPLMRRLLRNGKGVASTSNHASIAGPSQGIELWRL